MGETDIGSIKIDVRLRDEIELNRYRGIQPDPVIKLIQLFS